MAAGGGGCRGRKGRVEDSDVKLSKFLSYVCRHGAEKEGLTVHDGGFIAVSDILELRKCQHYSQQDVIRVVTNSDKQRFALRQTPNLQIRANQGHTMQVEGLELTPIRQAEDAPTVVHGTYHSAWNRIKDQGLSRMKRQHIHFAPGLPGESGVISGMRSSCQVLIFIDMRKALADGLGFFLSANNVILSPGDENGFILPKYFDKVQEYPSGTQMNM